MFPNIDPKKMQNMMKQMGLEQEEIDAAKVIIEKNDGSRTIIYDPSVVKIKLNGQESFQVSGRISEELESGFSEDDVKTVMEKTGASEKKAREALEKNNDIVEAIMELND
jgi:nascent polypeptide-associated complex subunit alpha